MGRIKNISSKKRINSRRNFKSKKRRKASVNRIKKKNSNKYTKKKINVKRRGIKYYSSGGSYVGGSLEQIKSDQQKPGYLKMGDAGGLSLMLADILEGHRGPRRVPDESSSAGELGKMGPIHIRARASAEAACRLGSCGSKIAQRNMRPFWLAPHYGERLNGIKYRIDRNISDEAKGRHAGGEVTLKCSIIHGEYEVGKVEINYKLYPPSIEGTTQSGGYIYLISINQTVWDGEDFSPQATGPTGMQILCSELAWLLHNNYIQIYWDMLAIVPIVPKENIKYYLDNQFEVVNSGNYKTIIPELETGGDTHIMIVNISSFIKHCQTTSGLNIEMGPY